MTSNGPVTLDLITPESLPVSIKEYVENTIDELLRGLPDPQQLSQAEVRGIIARYTAVLEGNFIYWMTATYLSVKSQMAHSLIEANLREEVRDNHPGMLRRFAVAANATSTDADRRSVDRNLQPVRAFVAKLAGLEIILMMALFEGFIAQFMPYLADLAQRLGSEEREYTDVHGVVDVSHTQELFRAFEAELAVASDVPSAARLVEGVHVLRSLIDTIIHNR